MKKKIQKIINKAMDIAEENPDTMESYHAKHKALVKIQKTIGRKTTKHPKQLYCNFLNYDGYWILEDISHKPYSIITEDISDVDIESYDFCSVPIEKYKEVK